MPIETKKWTDETSPLGPPADPLTSTEIDGAALNDLETRLSTYTDEAVAGLATLGSDGKIGGPGGSALSGLISTAKHNPVEAPGFQWVFNVRDFGAKGDGETDDHAAIAAAVAAAEAAVITVGGISMGMGVVYFPAGYYVTGATIIYGDSIRLLGDSWASTLIKAKAGVASIAVVEGHNYASTGVKNARVEHLTIDGNKASTESVLGLKSNSQNGYFEHVVVRNCDGHGFSTKLSSETEQLTFGLDNVLRSCRAIGCEGRGFNSEAHDTLLDDCQTIQCKEAGFYWTTNGYMIQCHAWCSDSTLSTATVTGYRLSGSVHCVDCIAEGATKCQIEIVGNVVGWSGGEVFNASGAPNAALFEFNGGTSAMILDPWCHEYGSGGAFKFTTNGQASTIRARVFDSGNNPATVGTPHEEIYWELTPGGATPIGEGAYKKVKVLTLMKFSGTAPKNSVYVDEADGLLKTRDNNGTVRRIGTPSEEEVTAAATITVSTRISTAKVTGNTEITKINPTFAGHVVVLRFTGTPLVKSAGNLLLAKNMEAQNGSLLAICCDGTNWEEITRNESRSGGTIASEAEITVPNRATIVKISGAAEIKKIKATNNGQAVIFIWAAGATAKFVNGENLKLSSASISGNENDAVTLACDGTNWFQVSPLNSN